MGYDVIVVGSGLAGSSAAMEACENGLRTLVLEAGPTTPSHLFSHGNDTRFSLDLDLRFRAILNGHYREAFASYLSAPLYEVVSSTRLPYKTAPGKPYSWTRVRVLNGRGLFWGRLALRHTDNDFESGAISGVNGGWPVKINELEPFYNKIENVMDVVGPKEEDTRPEHRSLLANKAAPVRPVAARIREQLASKYPNISVYNIRRAEYANSEFSPMLKRARATGNLELRENSVASALTLSEDGSRATGIEIADRITKRRTTAHGKVIMLAASSFESIRILLNTEHEQHRQGVGNSSGLLGVGVMDHVHSKFMAHIPALARLVEKRKWDPLDMKFFSYNGFYIPPFMSRTAEKGFLGCYQIEGMALPKWDAVFFAACGEMLPSNENTVRIDPTRCDVWGIPILNIDISWSDNERRMLRHQAEWVQRIISALGGRKSRLMMLMASARSITPGIRIKSIPGDGIHEVGGARMGTNPGTSVTNPFGQLWDVPNVFVADGAVMPSMGYQNTTLTIQALAVRSAAYAAKCLHQGKL